MVLSGNQRYEVSVVTSAQVWAGTEAALYIQFLGDKGKTPTLVNIIFLRI
jgi:hypothetical protein